MKKFEFTQGKTVHYTKFNGTTFYKLYKDAEFLKSNENVETILSKGYELRKTLKEAAPGETIVVGKMMLTAKIPLLVKNTSGPNVVVEVHEFTYNRLAGFVAAFAILNRDRFPTLKATEAEALGLVWDPKNVVKCVLYLSAVSGTEHFQQFSYFPLLCALRKLQLQKITLEPVLKMAKIKNEKNESMATVLKKNYIHAAKVWTLFPEAKGTELNAVITRAPPALRKLFIDE